MNKTQEYASFIGSCFAIILAVVSAGLSSWFASAALHCAVVTIILSVLGLADPDESEDRVSAWVSALAGTGTMLTIVSFVGHASTSAALIGFIAGLFFAVVVLIGAVKN
jgi:hypothetical protein